eukprot:TRINITY_DN25666_c0_g2_i1.p1 TRINITY_DN25666_c0_g2~~TRINITY_DN25666_c0_g2_i1.p1  ORF type:complete len:279 (+),score=-81.93 TRINITY_DN25666_c0_g2_i1:2177-3013(+)
MGLVDCASIAQSAEIDSSARIDVTARIGPGVVIGPWVFVGPNVDIGEGSVIQAHTVIVKNTRLGSNNIVHPHVVLGGDPQDVHHQASQPTTLSIGKDNIIREFVTINRGSSSGSGETRLGSGNHLLAYSHIAHDCVVGNHITMINNATLGGHVTVEDYAMLGAFTAVHQFCRIGAYSFLSQATEVSKDVLPYLLVRGIPGFPCGLNTIGLQRRGFSEADISVLKKAYAILYRRGLSFSDAKQALESLAIEAPLAQNLVDFIARSQRGIARREASSRRG